MYMAENNIHFIVIVTLCVAIMILTLCAVVSTFFSGFHYKTILESAHIALSMSFKLQWVAVNVMFELIV